MASPDDASYCSDFSPEVFLGAALEEQEKDWSEDDEEDEDEEEDEEDPEEDDDDENNQQQSPDDDDGSSDMEIQEQKQEKEPEPWVLPLPEVTNNIYLKSYFPVLKYIPGKGPEKKFIWVVDHFNKSFYCLDDKGKLKKEHASNKLLQLERNIMDSRRARLMFFDAPKSYEILFPNTEERERFYETGSAIRPAIRVFAPSLTKPDCAVDGGTTTTTIDGVKENAMVRKVQNPLKKTGELQDRELQGRCKINSSNVIDEPVTIWIGTYNLTGSPPPTDKSCLESWCPKGKYDIYAVGVQEASYQKSEDEWYKYIQDYLGKDYLTLANMLLWEMNIIVLCKKKNLLKITNVEGSTVATLHKEKCGMKGGVGIALKFHNTSMAFINCQLPARLERAKMRNTVVAEIMQRIQLANKDLDLATQFHHVFFFGDLNYRTEMENAEAEDYLQSKEYNKILAQDQLCQIMEGSSAEVEQQMFHGFKETPITFAPTYRFKRGTSEYMRDRGRAPSYCSRVLHKSMGNTVIKCTQYGTTDKVLTSEHMPVYATFVIRCVRPSMCCFHRDQEPRPKFTFSSIRFIEQDHLMFNKPQLIFYTPFSGTPHKGKPGKDRTMLPEFSGETMPEPIMSVVQMNEYLERMHILMVFRDCAEPREDKMFRGGAIIELSGEKGDLNVGSMEYDTPHSGKSEVLCNGRKVGMVEWNYTITNMGYNPPSGGAPGRVPKDTLMDGDPDAPASGPGKLGKDKTAAFEGD